MGVAHSLVATERVFVHMNFSLEVFTMLSWCMRMCLVDFLGFFFLGGIGVVLLCLKCFSDWSRICVSVVLSYLDDMGAHISFVAAFCFTFLGQM